MRWLRYLLPFDRFVLESGATTAELAARLSARVSTKSIWSFSKPKEPFRGRVSEESFSLHPVIDYRNSFKPVVLGRFKAVGGGARIVVSQRPALLALGFMSIWFAAVIFINSAIMLSSTQGEFVWFGAAMLFLGAALVNGCFWYEARHTEGELRHIFGVPEPH